MLNRLDKYDFHLDVISSLNQKGKNNPGISKILSITRLNYFNLIYSKPTPEEEKIFKESNRCCVLVVNLGYLSGTGKRLTPFDLTKAHIATVAGSVDLCIELFFKELHTWQNVNKKKLHPWPNENVIQRFRRRFG